MVDQAAALRGIRQILEGVAGIAAAYSWADADDHRIPMAVNALPCALVLPGPTREFVFGVGSQRHTYEVEIQILAASSDPGIRAAASAPLMDAVMAALISNTANENGLWNSLVFERSGGAEDLEYAGTEYSGYRLFVEVSEQGSATPAVGVTDGQP